MLMLMKSLQPPKLSQQRHIHVNLVISTCYVEMLQNKLCYKGILFLWCCSGSCWRDTRGARPLYCVLNHESDSELDHCVLILNESTDSFRPNQTEGPVRSLSCCRKQAGKRSESGEELENITFLLSNNDFM